MPKKIEISHKTIIFTVLFLISLGLLYLIRDILLMLFVAVLLMAILEPLVNFLSKTRVPRTIAVLISYILVIGVFGGAFALIIPAVADQTTKFVDALPAYVANLGVAQDLSGQIVTDIFSIAGDIPGQVVKFTLSIFSNVISIVTVLVFSFYLLVSRNKMVDSLGAFFGEEKKNEFGRIMNNFENRLGGWARGQITLMITVGILTYIGLVIMGIPYALPLAILAGVLEIIPLLGPIISAVPIALIGFGISPVIGFAAIALSFLVQQIENYLLVPKIMEKSVGVSPIITLLALAIGARFAGVVGAIISIPTVITLQVLAKEYLIKE